MSELTQARIALVVVSFLLVLCFGMLVIRANAAEGGLHVRIPHCEEDERYLKGKGDYDGEKWSRYVCVHPDSFNL